MRETYVVRIGKEEVATYLGANVGVPYGVGLEITVERDDPLFDRISALAREFQRRGEGLFLYWGVTRDYTPEEIAAAEVFDFAIQQAFEPPGEETGTEYDESSVCWQELKSTLPDPPSWWEPPTCGVGRHQVSELRLNLRNLRPSLDVAKTIAGDEWVVSQRFRDLWLEAGLTGAAFEPVVPVGRSRRNEQVRYQLKVTSKAVDLHEDSRIGLNPFNPIMDDYLLCPLGHLSGLNLVSELFLRRESYDGSDIVVTRQVIGYHAGSIWPRPLMAVSARAYHLLRAQKITGVGTQVAYLR